MSQTADNPDECRLLGIFDCIPTSSAAPRLVGHYFLSRGQITEAVGLLRQNMLLDKMAAFWLGEAYEKLGRKSDALASWHEAGAAPYFLVLGHKPYEAGDLVAACLNYQRAVDIAPEMAEAHMYLGNCHNRQGDYVLAQAEYRRAIELDPDFGYPYIHLARMLATSLNQPDAGRTVLRACITQSRTAKWRAECTTTLAEIR